jgi:hypothetical protein
MFFSISVNTSSAEGPDDDICSNAKLIDPSRNTTIFGSTTDAIVDFYQDSCSGLSTGRDVWYQVVGNGEGMLASLCSPETDFDSQLSVYSSIEADGFRSNLECVVSNDDSCGGSASQVWWLSENDRVYLIQVNGLAGSCGNFVLTVREQVDEPIGERN